MNIIIRKKTIRLAVEDTEMPSTEVSFDTLLYRHIENLSAVGGEQEWMRGALRSYFMKECLARPDCNSGEIQEMLDRVSAK
jgi:hypothetical protein